MADIDDGNNWWYVAMVFVLLLTPYLLLSYKLYTSNQLLQDTLYQNQKIGEDIISLQRASQNCNSKLESCTNGDMELPRFSLYQQAGNTLCYNLQRDNKWVYKHNIDKMESYCFNAASGAVVKIDLVKNAGQVTTKKEVGI